MKIMDKKITKFDWKEEVSSLFFLILGIFIYAFAVNVIYVPTNMAMGGATGVANALVTATQGRIPFGVFSLLINVPILILGWKEFGFRMVYRSIIGTIIFSFSIDFTNSFMHDWYDIFMSNLNSDPDLIVLAIVSGVLSGIGIGFILKGNYTTGGTDILAVVASNRISSITVGNFTIIFDLIVIVFNIVINFIFGVGNIFQTIMLALYSFISLYFTGALTDTVLLGTDSSQAVHIISDKSEVISKDILKRMDRGITGLKGKGMYTQNDKTILYVVLDSREVPILKTIVAEHDENAFIIVNEVKDVSGEGFTREKT